MNKLIFILASYNVLKKEHSVRDVDKFSFSGENLWKEKSDSDLSFIWFEFWQFLAQSKP